MKTLVIHPKDKSTDFLSEIYAGKDWTVITKPSVSKSFLKQQIQEHDRIVMLGHGCDKGLFAINGKSIRMMIDSSLVYLLRDKECVCIWCNANQFVKKYELKGFHTGMIISEWEEAYAFCVYEFSNSQIEYSNQLFAKVIANHFESETIVKDVLKDYQNSDNPIIGFNRDNIFST